MYSLHSGKIAISVLDKVADQFEQASLWKSVKGITVRRVIANIGE